MPTIPTRIAGGIWRFRPRLDAGILVGLAKEWKEKEPLTFGHHINLHVRDCSGNQYGIGFMFEYDVTLYRYEQFFEEMTDLLRRRFGNDFAGWDVSDNILVIK